MREGQAIRMIRLRLLALVLALALTWYAVNPAPGPARRVKRDEETPDEERRVRKSPARAGYELGPTEANAIMSASHSPSETELNIEDLEWPEVIDIG
jgi:hypothetical protein